MPTQVRQSDSAYDELKELIITVQLAPDSLISERELMTRLGVGRTPLREALQRLASDRLVRAVPRRGYFVAGLTYNGALHSYELRRHIEGLGARLAAQRATDEHRRRLQEFLHDVEEGMHSETGRWHLAMDARLHELVAETSGNPYIQQVLSELYDVSVRELYVTRRPFTILTEEIQTFRTLVDAICRSDSDAAEAAMREHLSWDAVGPAGRGV